MVSYKVTNFKGYSPKIAAELLDPKGAQVALNCNLISGNIVPLREAVAVESILGSGDIKALYGFIEPELQGRKWFSWANEVSLVRPSADSPNLGRGSEDRFYFTGGGTAKPQKFSTRHGAAGPNNQGPYPKETYDLAVPSPDEKPDVFVISNKTFTIKTVMRAGDGIVSITYDGGKIKDGSRVTVGGMVSGSYNYAHNGEFIDVSGVPAGAFSAPTTVPVKVESGKLPSQSYSVVSHSGTTVRLHVPFLQSIGSGKLRFDLASINGINVKVSSVSDDKIEYYSPGFEIGTSIVDAGKASLALGGLDSARTYVFTYATQWGEESQPSAPTDEKFVREGQVIELKNFPSAPPKDSLIKGIRVYRSVTGQAQGTSYLRLAELLYPVEIVAYHAENGVVGIVCQKEHNLTLDSVVWFDAPSSSGVSYHAGLKPSKIIDDFKAEFKASGTFALANFKGKLYHDCSENPGTTNPRYFGKTIKDSNSDESAVGYDFVDDYKIASLTQLLETTDYLPPPDGLKGLTLFGVDMLVGFSGSRIYFSERKNFHAWPEKGVYSIGERIVALSYFSGNLLILTDGFPYIASGNSPGNINVQRLPYQYPCLSAASVVVSDSGVIFVTTDGLAFYTGKASLLTKDIFDFDTWGKSFKPENIIGSLYGDFYIGFDRENDYAFLYYAAGDNSYFSDFKTNGKIQSIWYDVGAGLLYYTIQGVRKVYQFNAQGGRNKLAKWRSKVFETQTPVNFGAVRVVADFKDVEQLGAPETIRQNPEDIQQTINSESSVDFSIFSDGEKIFGKNIDNDEVVRLPSGYLNDSFEIELEGRERVRSVRLAETPTELKDV